jgi:1,4-dihydroxy-2-naphthoyl-CoA synthase
MQFPLMSPFVPTSIRVERLRQIGEYFNMTVPDGDAIVGGRFYTLGSVEVTRWIGEGWGLAAFVDAGDAVDRPRDTSLSIGYGADSLSQLVDLVGPSVAKEIMFTARRYTAHEAHRIGLVNHVLQANMLEAFVQQYADTIADNAPLSIVAAKHVINEYCKDADKRNQALADKAVAACFASQDYVEGRRAFMEKRKPVWQGK